VKGEAVYLVAPLSLPLINSTSSEIGQFDAVRLFVERAHAILHGFELTDENCEVVAHICRHLDGIPLAIELASARVNLLTVNQIEERLNDRFKLLTSTKQADPAHHQTLRASIDWSYALLSGREQNLLCRLAAFSTGWTIDSVEAICADEFISRTEMLDLLSSLVNKSLIVAETLAHAQARYRLLESIREYALDQMQDGSETDSLRDRHLEYFTAQAEENTKKLHSEYQKLWLNWMEIEHDNFRAALEWSLKSEQIETGVRLANALYEFWAARGYVLEGFNWYERFFAQQKDGTSGLIRARAATYASFLAGMLGDSTHALIYGEQGVTLSEVAGKEGKLILAMASGGVSGAARASGDHVKAYEYAERAVSILRETDMHFGLAMSLISQSNNALALGKNDIARTLLNEGLTISQKDGDSFRHALALDYLGDLERCEGHYLEAQTAYEKSLAIFHELGAVRESASLMHNLGHTFLHLGNNVHASQLFKESMEMHKAQGNRRGIAECLTGFAAIAIRKNLAAQAAGLLASSIRFGGETASTMWAAEQIEYERILAAVHQRLTDQEFEAAQAEGQAWSLEQAMDVALKLTEDVDKSVPVSQPHFGLSTRELEIVLLIAEGKSNSEIADQLVLSKRTVEKHVANVLAKLSFTNRTQAARWATENLLNKS
jgi:predicted ATPase/DNA-binding NarL/FixJ family response regulator